MKNTSQAVVWAKSLIGLVGFLVVYFVPMPIPAVVRFGLLVVALALFLSGALRVFERGTLGVSSRNLTLLGGVSFAVGILAVLALMLIPNLFLQVVVWNALTMIAPVGLLVGILAVYTVVKRSEEARGGSPDDSQGDSRGDSPGDPVV